MINQMFSIVAQPHIMSNNAAGRTELDNRIGFCAGVTLKRVCTICWAVTGVLAIAYYGAGKMDGDHVFGAFGAGSAAARLRRLDARQHYGVSNGQWSGICDYFVGAVHA